MEDNKESNEIKVSTEVPKPELENTEPSQSPIPNPHENKFNLIVEIIFHY